MRKREKKSNWASGGRRWRNDPVKGQFFLGTKWASGEERTIKKRVLLADSNENASGDGKGTRPEQAGSARSFRGGTGSNHIGGKKGEI